MPSHTHMMILGLPGARDDVGIVPYTPVRPATADLDLS